MFASTGRIPVFLNPLLIISGVIAIVNAGTSTLKNWDLGNLFPQLSAFCSSEYFLIFRLELPIWCIIQWLQQMGTMWRKTAHFYVVSFHILHEINVEIDGTCACPEAESFSFHQSADSSL